jgi:amino acid transporter
MLALKQAAGVANAGGPFTLLPLWFWASVLFFAIGIFFSIVMDHRLPESGSQQRATWATLQVLIGYAVILFAQWIALVTIAPEEPSLSNKDAVLSFKLWVMIMKRLPRLKECLWTALLGLSLMVGSVAFIGGFEHWFGYVPKSLAEQERELARTRKAGGGTPIVVPVD